ncbi:MAG: hypothetical protein DRJ97_04395 [Thermoprotei archaeon]|nr:MAG: hypothetical protein DRJ97_04395 [Thermoprotei archaeon]
MESALEAAVALSFLLVATAIAVYAVAGYALGRAQGIHLPILALQAQLAGEDLLSEAGLPLTRSLTQPQKPAPPGWPDPSARWIWMYDLSSSPQGSWWVCRPFKAPKEGVYTIHVAVDDEYQLYLNGTLLGGGSDYKSFKAALDTGWQLIAINTTCLDGTAGILLSVYDPDGDILFDSQPYPSWCVFTPNPQGDAKLYFNVTLTLLGTPHYQRVSASNEEAIKGGGSRSLARLAEPLPNGLLVLIDIWRLP